MKRYLLLGISLLLFACSKQSEVSQEVKNETILCCPPTVALQPCHRFSKKEAKLIIPKLKEAIRQYSGIELDFEVLPPIILADSLKNSTKTRYRADKIINSMSINATGHYVIIALTHDDISMPCRGHSDWGILGLSIKSKYVCIASDCRLKNKHRDFWKVIIHEFIHTFHKYPHCPKDNSSCIMQDCKGHADFSNKTSLCSFCDSLLNI